MKITSDFHRAADPHSFRGFGGQRHLPRVQRSSPGRYVHEALQPRYAYMVFVIGC